MVYDTFYIIHSLIRYNLRELIRSFPIISVSVILLKVTDMLYVVYSPVPRQL